ncbi:MAG: OmpA family protein [bacterium]
MRRLLVLVLAAGLAAQAAAWTGLSGGRGMFRVQDARSEGYWNGSLMLHGLARWGDYNTVPEAWRVGMTPSMSVYTNDLFASVALSPCDWFELYCWHGGVREYTSPHPDSTAAQLAWLKGYQNFWDWHNIVPGAKLSIPVIPVLKLGATGAWSLPRGDDFFRRTGWRWGRFGMPWLNGPSWSGLLTLDFQDLAAWTPALHLNYGQAYDSYTPRDGGEIKTTLTTWSAALEYQVDRLDIFAEFVSEQEGSASPLDKSGRIFVTPGIKLGFLHPFYLEAGASIGLSDPTPDLELIAGLGLSGRLFTPRRVTTGTIAGRVTDAETGAPLAADISFPGTSIAPLGADADKGTFAARDVPAGHVMLQAEAAGYLPGEEWVEVVAGQTVQVELALRPEPANTGSVAGSITDAATGQPVSARVEFPGSRLAGLDAADGEFAVADVPAGKFWIQVVADGYLTATSTVTVVAGEEARADFALVRKGVTIPLKVFFDFDRSTLKPESQPALEGAAKIMRENAGIRVEIQGHTDNIGGADYNRLLSQRRAQAVVDYLVDKLGIERGRLSARGFGPDQPIATNATAEGQAQNRRAEFIVLD